MVNWDGKYNQDNLDREIMLINNTKMSDINFNGPNEPWEAINFSQ